MSCINGYYITGLGPTTCASCNNPCKTCVSNADKCTTCIDGYYYKLELNNDHCEICKYPC